jgi:hypothetical protein
LSKYELRLNCVIDAVLIRNLVAETAALLIRVVVIEAVVSFSIIDAVVAVAGEGMDKCE